MTKEIGRKPKEVFIQIKPFFPANAKPYFVGPFENREGANAEIEEARFRGNEIIVSEKDKEPEVPKNLKIALNAEVLSRSFAIRAGMRETDVKNKKSNLVRFIPDLPKEELEELEPVAVAAPVQVLPVSNKQPIYEPIAEPDEALLSRIPEDEADLVRRFETGEISSKDVIIIDKFPYTTEWLRRHGIVGRYVRDATPAMVEGKIIVGVVSRRLDALAKEVWQVDLPDRKVSQRGLQLTPDEMDEAGARIRRYKVTELYGPVPRIR